MSGEQQFGLFAMAMFLVLSFLMVAAIWEEDGYESGYNAGFSDARGRMCNAKYVKCSSLVEKPKESKKD